MIEYLSPALSQRDREAIEREVTELGLAHRLMTQWTSFVAVAKEVVNPAERAPRGRAGAAGARRAGHRYRGVMPVRSRSSRGSTRPLRLAGASRPCGPEPSVWLALLAIAADRVACAGGEGRSGTIGAGDPWRASWWSTTTRTSATWCASRSRRPGTR
jgi:hypothetical protein